jgi:sortase (surface protein transpeptidase)
MQELQGLLAAQPFSAPNFSHRAAILKRSGAVTGHMIFKMLEQYKQQQQQQQQQQAVVAEGQQQQQQQQESDAGEDQQLLQELDAGEEQPVAGQGEQRGFTLACC